jgi:hypothetical protein
MLIREPAMMGPIFLVLRKQWIQKFLRGFSHGPIVPPHQLQVFLVFLAFIFNRFQQRTGRGPPFTPRSPTVVPAARFDDDRGVTTDSKCSLNRFAPFGKVNFVGR